MLAQFARRMHHHFGGLWVSQQAQTEEDLRVNLMQWRKDFAARNMTMRDVEAVLGQATTENCPFPTPVHFFGLWDKINETSLGHASFRPAKEVLAQHQGTSKAAQLPDLSEEGVSRRKVVGRAALAALKASFDA